MFGMNINLRGHNVHVDTFKNPSHEAVLGGQPQEQAQENYANKIVNSKNYPEIYTPGLESDIYDLDFKLSTVNKSPYPNNVPSGDSTCGGSCDWSCPVVCANTNYRSCVGQC